MNFFTFSVLATTFLASSSRVLAQERFAVTIHHFVQPNLTERVFACGATIISDQHVLTTARCVDVDAPLEIAIQVQLVEEGGLLNSTLTGVAHTNGVDKHPNYVRGQIGSNIAVVKTSLVLTSNILIVPRSLGSLPSVQFSFCRLFGWETAEDSPRSDSILVWNSVECNTHAPFCTFVESLAHPSCTAMEASPVVCNDGAIDGILVDQGCTQNGTIGLLRFYSIGVFREWIDVAIGRANATTIAPTTVSTTTAGAKATAVSSLLVLAAINFVRLVL